MLRMRVLGDLRYADPPDRGDYFLPDVSHSQAVAEASLGAVSFSPSPWTVLLGLAGAAYGYSKTKSVGSALVWATIIGGLTMTFSLSGKPEAIPPKER